MTNSKDFINNQEYIAAIEKYIADNTQNIFTLKNGKSKLYITTNPEKDDVLPINSKIYKETEYFFGIKL